ncbi:MAG: tetratricopeptide repeat protein, partial [Phycisphaeraceae bacterium]
MRAAAIGLVAALILLAWTPALRAAPELADQRYKQMTPFERAQYDKAIGLFKQNEYRAAAAEFGKFMSQHANCSQLSHMILMQGLSHHRDKKRNQAIKMYDQVLDFFGHVTADAAPALYYQGIAQIDNGDVIKGVATLREMVEDERYRNHAYAAGALRRLADYYAREGETARAVKYWKQTLEDFGDTNQSEANRARANVTEYYIAKGDYEAYESWIVDEDKADDAGHRRWVSDHAWGQAYHREGHWHGQVGDSASVQQRRRDFWEYFVSRRPWWEKDGRTWDYHQHAVNYATFRLGEDKPLQEVLEEAVQHATSLDDTNARDGRLWWLADRIRRRGHYELARFCLDKMSDQLRATYGRYQLLHQRKKWEDAANVLQQIIAADDDSWT